MKYTSAEAAKLLRRLNEEEASLLRIEAQSREFLASVGEDPDSVRPAYDFAGVQAQIEETEAKIRKVKHAINTFNLTHTVPGFDMTIDQMLVYIPQLSSRKSKFASMMEKLPKTREGGMRGGSIIDYRYANYDIAQAAAEYSRTADELSRAQTALDAVNGSETMEIDIQ